MDPEFSEELTGLMPVVRHQLAGVECPGRVVAVVEANNVELRCQQCGGVVGVVQVGIIEGLLGLDCADAVCPYCQKVNDVSALTEPSVYVCQHCGKSVRL